MTRNEPDTLEVIVAIAARIEHVGWNGLTVAEQNYRAVWHFESELTTVGITQFLRELPGTHMPVVVRGLEAVGAFHTRQLLLEAIPLVETSDALFAAELAQISTSLRTYPEDLRALLAKYLEREAASFPARR